MLSHHCQTIREGRFMLFMPRCRVERYLSVGLQFVVLILITGRPVKRGEAQASNTFTTPSVVHFAVVLLLSAVVSAPWDGIGIVAILWGLVGLSGIVYTVVVARRMRRQTAYGPYSRNGCFMCCCPWRHTPY